MQICLLILLLVVALNNAGAQTIKRWSGGKIEMTDKQLAYNIRPQIFSDFNWTKPDIQSKKVSFENGSYAFTWGGKKYQIALLEDGKMELRGEGASQSASRAKSNGEIYYNKSMLPLKPIVRSRQVSYMTYEMQSVMVPKTRMVTRYQYNSSTKTSQPVYSSETYYAYETRSVPKTQWRWESYTDYVIDIPVYEHYSFRMPDSTNLLLYEIRQGGLEYYLQNSAYLSAVDAEGINHIIIDNNANGIYTDDKDKIMFNSWNPYSKESSYKKVRFFKENNWYDLDYLKNENFLTLSVTDSNVTLEYANKNYSGSKAKGSVTFTGLPKNVRLVANGDDYKLKEGTKTFQSEYGIFKVRIIREGFLDFETTYTVDTTNPKHEVQYEETSAAGSVEIQNIFASDYFVTVSNQNGYTRNYSNTTKFSVPVGDIEVSISTEGSTISTTFNMEALQLHKIDFEAELKKLSKEEPDIQEKNGDVPVNGK